MMTNEAQRQSILHVTESADAETKSLGPYKIKTLIAPDQEQQTTAYRVEIEPHTTSAVSYHKVAEELYYVLEGAGKAILDGKSVPLAPHDFLRLPPGTTHSFSTGEERLVLLDIHTPGVRPDVDTYFVGDTPEGFGGEK